MLKRLGGVISLILVGSICVAADISVKVSALAADIMNGQPFVDITLDKPLAHTLRTQFADLSHYVVTTSAIDSPPAAGGAAVNSVVPVLSATPEDDRHITLTLEGRFYGKFHVTVSDFAVNIGGDTYHFTGGEKDLEITQPYKLRSMSRRFDFGVNSDVATVTFEMKFAGDYKYVKGKPVTRTMYSLSGNYPITIPEDVRDIGSNERDRSEEVADFLSGRFEQLRYDGSTYLTYGVTARSTAEAKGAEVVLSLAGAKFLDSQGRSFAGLSAEVGTRDGDAEWESVTSKAPDRGNFVARIGGVVEFAPELGPINRDLGEGLRFFVRVRGWLDRADNVDGSDSGWRFRPFLDSELFYNLSEDQRFFVRFEQGYLPPNLSKNTRRLFAGLGVAF